MSPQDDSTPPTAQDAVRKAQEIVARLSNQYPIVVADSNQQQQQQQQPSSNGTTETATPSTSTTAENTTATTKSSKRKRWGIMSSSSFNEDSKNNEVSKRPHTDGTTAVTNNPVTANPQIPIAQLLMGTTAASNHTPSSDVTVKRLWVTVNHERPAAHYVAYLTPKLRPIVAHANGHTDDPAITADPDATQEDAHENDDDDDGTKLRIVFKGKGSTNIPPLPGVPEEPLHIYMTGPKALVEATTTAIDDLIHEASHAEPLIEAVIAAQQAQELALITTMESIQTNTYKPMSVTSLIHGNSNTDVKDGSLLALPADRLAAALLHGTTAALTQEMEVPNHVVGTIIGRGGETIASIQAQTNCKLQIQKEQDMVPGQVHRIITMSANSQAAIDACQSIVQSLVNERIQKMNAGGNHYQGNNNNASSNIVLLDGSTVPSHHSLVEVLVPDADVGLVIGKMGGRCIVVTASGMFFEFGIFVDTTVNILNFFYFS